MALLRSGKTVFAVPPSTEEDDLLKRSSKKIKNGGRENGVDPKIGHWPKLGSAQTTDKTKNLSFAETLKGVDHQEENSDDEEGKDDEISDDTMSEKSASEMEQEKKEPLVRIREDPQRNFPTFHFSGRLKKRLYRAWRKAVIVKLLDHHIGYKALEARLQALWAKRGVISLINIGHGFYVVKLSNKEDYFNALTGGPWMIYDHYLTVRPWEPRFNPAKAKIDKVAVWVRLPRVSLEYYDEEALTMIGNRIGETLKVDVNTSCQLRGHYARICVLVDLGKQLMSRFSLDGDDYYLEYEGLHALCTRCGIYGHHPDLCPSKKKEPVQNDRRNEQNTRMHDEQEEFILRADNEQEHWKIVQKQRRLRKVRDKPENSLRQQNRGTRFDILADVEDPAILTNMFEENAVPAEGVSGVVPFQNVQKSFVRRNKGKKTAQKSGTTTINEKALVVVPTMDTEEIISHESRAKREKRTREMFSNHVRNNEIMMLTWDESNDEHELKKNDGDGNNDGVDKKSSKDKMECETEQSQLPHDPGEEMAEAFGNKAMDTGPSSESPSPESEQMCIQSDRSIVPETQVEEEC